MPNPDNEPQIPKNQSPITDDRTGMVSRDWYRFFLNLLNRTGSGTVTSVDVSGGTTGLTTSGGPVTTSGTITIAGTLDVDNGGTGATTAAGARTNLSVPSTTGSGASGTWGIDITGNAATVTNGVYTTGSYADPTWITSIAGSKVTGTVATTNGGTGLSSIGTANQLLGVNNGASGLEYKSLVAGSNITITQGVGTVTINSSNPGGTVTSVGLSLPAQFTVTGSPVTGSGTLTGAWANQTANLVFASPNGSTGVPSFRSLVSADIPALSYVSSVSGTSPVVSSGGLTPAISLASGYGDTQNPYASKTANFFLAAPNGIAGVPTFRAIVAADIPTLNQNTTGTASNVTGTVAVANGGTGATTAATARTNLGATTVGSNFFTLANPSAITFVRINADNTVSTLDAATFRTAIGAGTGNGTVTSVTGTSPVASSGGTTPAISLSSGYGDTQNPYASKTANFVLAAPNGVAGVPTFRAIVAADIPTLNQNTTGSAATLTTGRTISITGDLAYTSPSFDGSANVTAAGTLATVNANVGSFTNASITVNGKGLITAASSGTAPVTSVTGTSPVVSSGGTTPAISLASGYGDTQNPYASKTANFFLAAPNGTAGAPTFRAIVAADVPTLNQNTTGTASNVTGTVAIANGGSGQTTAQTAMNTFAGAVTSGQYLRGNGTNVVMSAIQAADVPTLNQNTTGTASNVTGTVAIANGGTGQTTQQTAINALAGAVTSGQFLRGNGTNVVMAAIQASDVPTLNQNTTGTASNVTGVVAVANGGSGQTTAQTAMNTFAGAVTSGQYLRGNGTNVVMSAIQAADVPTLNQNTTGTASNVTGTVAIANGGTGQTTKVAAFDALSPASTKGDLIAFDGTDNVRLPVGADGLVLQADSTQTTGLKWAAAGSSGATITNDTATSTNVYPTFVATTSGTLSTINTSNAKLLYKPSTGELTSTAVVASNGIFVNNLTISTSYTVATGTSGMSAGPVTVAGGVTVTVASGSRWVVM